MELKLYQVWDEDDDLAWVQAESFEAAAKLVPAAAVVTNVLQEEAQQIVTVSHDLTGPMISLWDLRQRQGAPAILAWKRMLGLPARRPLS